MAYLLSPPADAVLDVFRAYPQAAWPPLDYFTWLVILDHGLDQGSQRREHSLVFFAVRRPADDRSEPKLRRGRYSQQMSVQP